MLKCFTLFCVAAGVAISCTSAQAGVPVDVSKVSYDMISKKHYSAEFFKKNIADDVVGAGNTTWEDSPSGLNSCAIRMSIAMA